MDKKGFTITELLAVLVLLGILLTLAGNTLTNVRESILNREYENLIEIIEVAAEKYFADTGATQVIVETLINEGLVVADDENGFVYNPLNKEKLNCNVLNIKNGKASWTEQKTVIEGTDKCTTEVADNQALKIVYTLEGTNVIDQEIPAQWLRGDITLKASLDPDGSGELTSVSLSDKNVTWISPLAPDEAYNGVYYQIKNNQTVNDEFEITVNHGGKQYTKTGYIRVDNTPPVVQNLLVVNPDSWEPKKTISFRLADEDSGIKGYQITYEPDYTANWVFNFADEGAKEVTLSETIDFSGKEEATIYIWVLDEAGNVNNYDSSNLEIDNIDNEGASELSIMMSPTDYTQKVTLTGKAKDTKSGLVAATFTSRYSCDDNVPPISFENTFTATNEEISISSVETENKAYYFWVKDAAGNYSCLEKNVSTIDKNIDKVIITNPMPALATTLELTVSGEDLKSGIAGWQVTTSNTKPSANSSWNTTGIAANKKTFSSTYTVKENGTYYLWVKDSAGNIEGGTAKSGNGNISVITVNNIDIDSPVFTDGGKVSLGSVTKTHWSDDSSPVSAYYYVGTTRITPNANSLGWVYSPGAYTFNYSSTCGTYYYVYVKAVDALDNYVIRYLGSAYTGGCEE